MSQILKAKNRIMSRSKLLNEQSPNEKQQRSIFNDATFDLDPANVPKKFNISSISMKFQRNIQNQKQIQINRRSISPQYSQFSRTQRINPIRHFESHNLNALSESKSHQNLIQQQKNRRISVYSQFQVEEISPQNSQRKSGLRSHRKMDAFTNDSPIGKIKRTVHNQPLNLLIEKVEIRRCQSPFKPRQCDKQYMQSLRQLNQQDSKGFIDVDFPPKRTAICSTKQLKLDTSLSLQKISMIYQKKDKQISMIKSCQPTSINCGKLTNPFLFSAITILAQYPHLIIPLIQNQTVNTSGFYYIKLCKDGVWRYIVVDDYIPVQNINDKSQCIAFNTQEKYGVCEIWPSLIEKALAKVYGSYLDLSMSRRDGISPLFRALTGFPASKYDLIKDVRSYLVLIDSALKRGHIIVLEDILPEFQNFAESKSIALNQSYHVLEIQKNCFVLRNLLDLDLITKLSFDEVMMFSSLVIFRSEKNFTYVSQKLRHKRNHYSTIKVSVSCNTNCYWDIWQNNPAYYKHHLNSLIEYQVSPFKIIVQPLMIENENQYDSKPEEQIIVESGKQISMKKGQYLLTIHLCQKKQLDFTISYYGQKDVQISRLKTADNWHDKCCDTDINH